MKKENKLEVLFQKAVGSSADIEGALQSMKQYYDRWMEDGGVRGREAVEDERGHLVRAVQLGYEPLLRIRFRESTGEEFPEVAIPGVSADDYRKIANAAGPEMSNGDMNGIRKARQQRGRIRRPGQRLRFERNR